MSHEFKSFHNTLRSLWDAEGADMTAKFLDMVVQHPDSAARDFSLASFLLETIWHTEKGEQRWIALYGSVFGGIMSNSYRLVPAYIWSVYVLASLPSPTVVVCHPTPPTHPSWADDIIAAAALSVTPHCWTTTTMQKDTELQRQNPFEPTEENW